MIRLKPEQFVVLACLSDYDFTAYEILGFARELGYMIPLESLFPTIESLLDMGLIQARQEYNAYSITTNPPVFVPIHMQTFELTPNGTAILIDEMQKVDLLIKRIRKQVRTLQ